MSAPTKTTAIFVNTREVDVAEKKIAYDELIVLAYPGEPVTPEMAFTVTYSRGPGGHGSGSLTAGGEVEVKKGMVFDVYRTIRS
ncbi:multiubiquitin domain-containing protein [Sinomonas sp. RB5]